MAGCAFKIFKGDRILMGQITVEKNVGGIEGLCVITPAVHGDSRGYFMETYNENDMKEAGINITFVQDNQSMSTKGVLRGLHFQKQFPQTKLVRAIKGSVFDVAVIIIVSVRFNNRQSVCCLEAMEVFVADKHQCNHCSVTLFK